MLIDNPKSRRLSRQVTRYRLLEAIREHSMVSRSKLSRITGFSAPIVSRITKELINENMVREISKAQAGKNGRRPVLLGLNTALNYLVAVDVGGSETRAVLTNVNSEIISRSSIQTPQDPSGPAMIRFLSGLIHSLLEEGRVPKDRLQGIVLSVGGILDLPNQRVIRFVSVPAMHDLEIGSPLSQEFGVPIRLVGSEMGAMVAEYDRAKANGESLDFLTVHCGYSVAIFPIMDYRSTGFRPHAGKIDFGHITYDLSGPECLCGSRGCIEAFTGGRAIARDARREPSDVLMSLVDGNTDQITAKMVFDAAIRGDRACMSIVRRAGSILGEMLSIFVQYHLPTRVVFFGGLVSGSTIYYDAVMDAMRSRISPERFESLQVQLSSLDKFATTVGATRLLSHDVVHASQNELVRMLT